jgi:MFS transporter, DHA2 family, multidrug resistance protein
MESQLPASAPDVPHVNPWIVAVSVMFATFLEVLDTTVVNVSLPHIAGSLSATPEEATWTLTSYLVANAIILPLTGWLSGYFGRKRLLMLAVSGFTLSSFLCGIAPSLEFLVVLRLVQGLTGGVLQPMSQAIMLEAFPVEQRGKGMAFWGLGIVVAPILGPVLGGWLTDNYSWRWVFYINLPIGIASLIMTKAFIFDPPYLRKARTRIDAVGIGLLVVGIGALQFVLDKGQQEDWFDSRMIVTLLVISIAALLGFVIHAVRASDPVLDLRVLKDRTYATGVTLMTVLGFVLFGSLVMLPLFLQTVLGYPSYQAGTAMAPRGFGAFLAMPLVGLMIGKFDPRKMVAGGLAIAGGTLYMLSSINLQAGYWDIFWPQFIQGMSMGLLFVPLSTVSMNSISREKMGNATSLFSLMRNLGAGIGIAVVATLVSRRTTAHAALLSEQINPYSDAARQTFEGARAMFLSQGSSFSVATQQAYAAISGMVHRQAAMIAFIDVIQLLGIVFFAVIPLVFIMKRPRSGSPRAGQTGAH